MKVRILLEPEIKQLLTLEDAIPAVEKSFAALNSGQAILSGVIHLDLPAAQGEVHVKSAYIQGEKNYVIKMASGFYLNPSQGLPVGDGMMLLFSAQTGRLEALLFDRGYITEMRTAAAGAVAAKYLSRAEIHRVGMIGSGTQARFQLTALAAVRNFEEVAVWSRHPDHVKKYVDDMSRPFPSVNFYPAASAEAAVRGADLIITATPSRSPIVRAEWLLPGVHLTAMGSDGPEKQELYPEVLERADLIYADSIRQAKSLGEIHHGLESGLVDESKISGEIGELILGLKPGRTRPDEISLADLTGLVVQDAAAASLVLAKARALSAGNDLEI